MTGADKIYENLTKLYGKRAILGKQTAEIQKKIVSGAKETAKPKAKSAKKAVPNAAINR